MRHVLTPAAEKRMEERFKLQHEAQHLLSVVAAEFQSDPVSVQCFDLRIVERIKYVSKRLNELTLV